MTIEEKINAANENAARNNNVVLSSAEIAETIAKAQPRFMIQSGLMKGDKVNFYGKTAASVLVNGVQTPIVGLYASVTKVGAPAAEERIVFMPGLIRQDPTRGFVGLLAESRFATTDMNKLMDEFIATGDILVYDQTVETPTERTRQDGTKFTSKQKFLELRKI